MEKTILMLSLAFAGLLASGEELWKNLLDDPADWPEAKAYQDSVRLEFGVPVEGTKRALRVTGRRKADAPDKDTAWHVRSKRIPLPRKSPKFRLTFSVKSEKTHRFTQGTGHSSAIFWYDADGREIAHDGVMLGLRKGGFLPWTLVGRVPERATAFEVQVGLDDPDLAFGETVCVTGASLELLDADAPVGAHGPDVDPPRVTRTSSSPTTDARTPLKLQVADESEVRWESLKVTVDGEDATSRFIRKGDVLTLTPTTPWAAGHHKVGVELADVHGNAASHRKVFFIGTAPSPDVSVTLRDDGVTLVGGKPFFPIGIYSVRKCPFNRWNLDRAMAELKAAGFNACHTYNDPTNPEFWEATKRHGLLQWVNATGFGPEFSKTARHSDQVLGWYVGDDTATHFTPENLRDRDESVKASDPNRLTVQADYVESHRATDRYQRYADATDVLLAEMYPVHGNANDTNCVAEVIRDMIRIRHDNRRFGGTRTHAVWPIIQNFAGWTLWKRYPTPDQVRAMTFATIVYGAKGMTWYTYAPNADSTIEKKRYDSGITGDEAAWTCATNLSTQLSSLSPVLLERGGKPTAAEILSGPAKDGYGNASVAYLVKRHGDASYVFAVNSTDGTVRARLTLGSVPPVGDVLWENRKVRATDGGLEETFAPYAVHVYRFR